MIDDVTWSWEDHLNKWKLSPPEYEGAWMKILAQLYPTGCLILTLKDYARLTGLIDNNIEEFIDFININKIADIETSGNKIFLKCRRIYEKNIIHEQLLDKDTIRKLKNRDRVRKFRIKNAAKNNPTGQRRMALLTELRENYHPKRAKTQESKQYNIYETILKQASRLTRVPVEREELEREEHLKILNYIDKLKSTRAWIDGGKYLPGLGRLLQERHWLPEKVSRDKESEELAAIFGD